MREIKFRYKYTDGRNWIVKSFPLNQIINGYPFDVTSDNPLLKHYKMLDEVDQYTGLKDKNGKEIYENDLVQDFRKTFKYKCVFRENGAFEFQNITTLNYAMLHEIWDVEIIGNVFENPELLQK